MANVDVIKGFLLWSRIRLPSFFLKLVDFKFGQVQNMRSIKGTAMTSFYKSPSTSAGG